MEANSAHNDDCEETNFSCSNPESDREGREFDRKSEGEYSLSSAGSPMTPLTPKADSRDAEATSANLQSEKIHEEETGSDREISGSGRNSSGDQADRKYYSNRDSDRHRSKRRSRSRHRSRSRSRSKSWTRSRSRSRSRSRGRSYRRHRHSGSHRRHRRSRSRSYNSYDSRSDGSRGNYSEDDDDYDRYTRRPRDSYKKQEPNSTIMVRGLATHLTENDLRQEILKCGLQVKDVRLIRNRETAVSRGFAFVEFNSVKDSVRWMEMKKGVVYFEDKKYEASLIYSIPKSGGSDHRAPIQSSSQFDWFCSTCLAHNFKRREYCYKCNSSKPDDQNMEMSDEISIHATKTLMLMNLDCLTTEEGIIQALELRTDVSSVPIKTVRVARESVTNLSRCICYLETNTVQEAVKLHTALNKELLEVDGRSATTAYCRTVSSSGNKVAAAALAAAQWASSQPSVEDEIERMAEYSAALYAKTPEEKASYLVYYREYYKKQQSEGEHSAGGSHTASESLMPSGSAVASRSSLETTSSQANRSVAPDFGRLQMDESYGYYYDPVTMLYFDTSTQYFFDPNTLEFMYWDLEKSEYTIVSNTSAATSESMAASTKQFEKKKTGKHETKQPKDEKDKPDRVKVAKKIALEMQKWAKTLNQKKDYSKFVGSSNDVPPSQPEYVFPHTSSAKPKPPVEAPAFESLISLPRNSAGLDVVEVYGEDSDSEEERAKIVAKQEFMDFVNIACTLCKRKFPNTDGLIKHTNMSDLHKTNLASLAGSSSMNGLSVAAGCSFSSASTDGLYRDRAEERRKKFGLDKITTKNSLKDLYLKAKKQKATAVVVDRPTEGGIKGDNIGNRMLQKMGWQEGEGLGREKSGRTDIITTERRAMNLGLGLKAPVIEEDDDNDRYAKARRLTLARYKELD